ncbi:MAG TPA: homoserine kinase [Marmoricola sp.]|nr:homoserine kinase [Marmoricola sp.]
MVFRTGPVTVEVPATSANLGPGFDCLGIALDLHDTLSAEVTGTGLQVQADGEGAGDLPCDDTHLVVRAMADVFAAVGTDLPGLRLRCHNRVPQGRGLGSSSAAIVGGMVLARALLADPGALSDADLLALANRREGHPDNVAPALLGGLTVSGQRASGAGGLEVWAVRARLAEDLAVTIFVPPTAVSTERARALLPETVPHGIAAANTGRAALLVAALAGETDQLLRATEDFLHQEFRTPAMPDTLALVHRLRAAGVPASVSGAGPAVLAWRVAGAPLDVVGPGGWMRLDLSVDLAGARVLA